MDYLKLCDSDYKFMTIIWENAPLNSGEAVKLCSEKLGWKKSTTYTVIKKLCDKGYIASENTVISVLIPKEKVQTDETEYFVERTFGGSLSHLVSAFLGNKKLTHKEAENLKKLIDEHKE